MKKLTILSATLLSSALILNACSSGTSEKKEETNKQTSTSSSSETKATQAFNFTAMDKDGKTVKLSDFKGKKVYLKFWASWCGPCKKSMPELMELAAKEDRGFEILSVIAPGLQGEKTIDQFPKWFEEQGYKDIPVLYDTKGAVFQDYQIRSIPTEYLIDSQGKIAKMQLGAISNADAEAAFAQMK